MKNISDYPSGINEISIGQFRSMIFNKHDIVVLF